MPFPCPGCGRPVDASPVWWILRCLSCGGRIRSRSIEAGALAPTYEVEMAGRPETRRRLEIPWDDAQRRHVEAWLLWSTVITLGLVIVLYGLARWWR